MNNTNRKKIEYLIEKNARLFNLKLTNKKQNIFTIWEDYHLSTGIENEIFHWDLQMTIGITKNGLIHMMMFMHPLVVTDKTKTSFIEFANAANLWLESSLGRFWVNSDNDFCYETYLPELFVEYSQELEQQLFDKPFSHFKDCLSPLMMLKDEKWTAEKAIEYLNRLREDGFVDNSEYGLW